MDYKKITVYTTSEGIDAVTALLYDLGITGLEITDKKDFEEFMQNNLRAWDMVDEELVSSVMSEETRVTFYLEATQEGEKIIAAARSALDEMPHDAAFGRLKAEVTDVKNEDWENNWKKYYKPLKIGKHIVIKPTWEDYASAPEDVVVELDPGMAFGTGSHASTSMCLELLEKTVKKGDRVLDIGTGSGILAIAALKLGASVAHAVDIDPLAVKIAKENAALNGCVEPAFTCVEGDLADKIQGEYDVVIANIVADVICELTKTVGRYIKRDGKFITSGIIDFKADKVKAAVSAADLNITEEKAQKDWRAFLCERNDK